MAIEWDESSWSEHCVETSGSGSGNLILWLNRVSFFSISSLSNFRRLHLASEKTP